MKHVQFNVNYCPYAAGDIASFDDTLADKYVELGLGDIVEIEGKKKKKVGE